MKWGQTWAWWPRRIELTSLSIVLCQGSATTSSTAKAKTKRKGAKKVLLSRCTSSVLGGCNWASVCGVRVTRSLARAGTRKPVHHSHHWSSPKRPSQNNQAKRTPCLSVNLSIESIVFCVIAPHTHSRTGAKQYYAWASWQNPCCESDGTLQSFNNWIATFRLVATTIIDKPSSIQFRVIIRSLHNARVRAPWINICFFENPHESPGMVKLLPVFTRAVH